MLIAVIIFSSVSNVWTACILAGICFTQKLPIPIIHRVPVGTIIILGITGLFILKEIVQRKGSYIKGSLSGKMMALCVIILIARFLVDRPGISKMGSAGGAGEAFLFILATYCYFMVMRIVTTKWPIKLNLKTLIILTI